MNIYDYILIFLLAVGLFFALKKTISNRKQGKCCSCSGGSSCSNCKSK